MEERECEHLMARSHKDKHPHKMGEMESDKQKLICGICNCYYFYNKKEIKR